VTPRNGNPYAVGDFSLRLRGVFRQNVDRSADPRPAYHQPPLRL
jgi:hypothetical protein